MKSHNRLRRRGISLIELVIVVVILGVIAALTLPNITRAATSSIEDDLRRDLATLRIAIDMYYEDHGVYPGARAANNAAPAGSAAALELQLTRATDARGRVITDTAAGKRYGPYLRRGIPPCPVAGGDRRDAVWIVHGDTAPAFCASAPDCGWVFNCDTGYIAANSDERDARGVRYDRY